MRPCDRYLFQFDFFGKKLLTASVVLLKVNHIADHGFKCLLGAVISTDKSEFVAKTLENAGFPDQNWVLSIFHGSRNAETFVGESLLHSLYRENHELKMFGFIQPFRNVSVYGREMLHKKIEPMIPVFFYLWVRTQKVRSKYFYGVSQPRQIRVALFDIDVIKSIENRKTV